MNKSKHIFLAIFAALTMLPVSTLAHTGVSATGGFAAGFAHPPGGADHVLAMLAVGLWAAQSGGRAVWMLPGIFVLLMLAGGGLGMAGIGLPYVEQAILLSVLALGALIAAACRLPLTAGAVIVGMFALFHGHAHGAEMPLASGALLYSLGFAAATAILHALGAAAGIALQQLNIAKAAQVAGGAIALYGAYLAAG